MRSALPLALVLALLVPPPVGAQDAARDVAPPTGSAPGRITGRVVDAGSGIGLPDAGIQVAGTSTGTAAGIEGRWQVAGLAAGTYTIVVRRIGYAPKQVTGVLVRSGEATRLDVALTPAELQLAAQVVTAEAERGSVSSALDQQRSSVNVVNAITAEQIARSPDGDAAQAIGRVAGVSVLDGKYVFVRGLGDRYTQTSLDGARLPSPEPERKVVPLDLFPSGLLQAITTVKTFTPDQPGDFSGAHVDIQTREFPARRTWSLSTSTGTSDAVLSGAVPMPRRVGGDLLALGSGARGLPGAVAAFGNFATSLPGQQDYNRMVAAFRNAWTPIGDRGGMNGSTAFSVGGNDRIGAQRVGYLASFTYGISHEARRDLVRAMALAQSGSAPEEVDRYEGEMGKSSVLWGGLLNLSTLAGDRTRLSLQATYNRTMDSEARVERGLSENLGIPLIVTRLRYVERSVGSAQLSVERAFSARSEARLSVSASGVTRAEPDRSEFVQAIFSDPATGVPQAPQWFSSSNEGAVRSFGHLDEGAYEARAHYRIRYGDPLRGVALKVGGLGRHVRREARSASYSINASGLTAADRELPAEVLFDGRWTGGSDSVFRVTPLGAGGDYTASEYLAAGFAMAEADLGPRWQVIGGARLEVSDLLVGAQPTIGARSAIHPAYTDLLPALAVTYRPTPDVNVRVSASQTLSRPEYRELAPIQYREVLGADNVLGNPGLRRAVVQNLDARWEWYPSPEEAVSVALFAKRFTDPIERVYRGSSGTRIVTFVNAAGADNHGVEVEIRKGLGFLAEPLSSLMLSANGSVMESRIRLAGNAQAVTNAERRMVGQAPWMANVGLTWTSFSQAASATLLYNVVGPRITDAGEVPLPDVVERERHVVDVAVRIPLGARLDARLDLKNLLDAPYRVEQGAVVRERYRVGRAYAIGLRWQP